MLVPSKKIFYAIEAILYIAHNARDMPISGHEIVQALGLPPRYLEAIIQKLVRAGILHSIRGAQGGYMLDRERRKIKLGDICAVIANDHLFPKSSSELGKKILHPTAANLAQKWQLILNEISIADLCNEAIEANIASTKASDADFAI